MKQFTQEILPAIPFILVFVSAMFNGMSDKIRHKYDKTYWSRVKSRKWQQWLNPQFSHVNKYWAAGRGWSKQITSLVIFLSKTLFVMFTDLWHLLKFIRISLLILAIMLGSEASDFIVYGATFWEAVQMFIVLSLCHFGGFELVYMGNNGIKK